MATLLVLTEVPHITVASFNPARRFSHLFSGQHGESRRHSDWPINTSRRGPTGLLHFPIQSADEADVFGIQYNIMSSSVKDASVLPAVPHVSWNTA